jgi:hypothetical protein
MKFSQQGFAGTDFGEQGPAAFGYGIRASGTQLGRVPSHLVDKLSGMPGIFISYRRDDSLGHAGRLHEALTSALGDAAVFRDLDDIEPGMDFVRTISDTIAAADTLLVVIGPRWLLPDGTGRRRIDDPADFVHIEIVEALRRNIRIVPILLNNATLPRESDLPEPLRPLARYQAMEISDQRWDYDVGRLLKILGYNRSRRLFAFAAIIALVGVALFLLLWTLPGNHVDDISGEWIADVPYDFGETHTESFTFTTDAGSLRGTATLFAAPRPILNGTTDGKRITFTIESQEWQGVETRNATHSYDGTLNGDQIRFVFLTRGGFNSHVPIEFVATRKAPRSP